MAQATALSPALRRLHRIETLLVAALSLLLMSARQARAVLSPQSSKPTTAAKLEELNHRAAAAMAANDFPQAISLLTELLKLQPRSAETHANLGLAYYSAAKYPEAAASYRQALKLNPRLPHARAFLGMAEAESGRFKESLPFLEKAFATETDQEIKRMVGLHLEQVHVALNEPLRAAEVVQKLLQLYPEDPDVLYVASRLFFRLSSQMVGRLVEVAPNSFRVRQLVGELLEANKQYAPAAEQYRKAIALEPNAPGLHYRLGRMLTLSSNRPEELEEARQAFLAELKLDPTHARCYVELAEMLRKQGQLEEAEKLLTRALNLNADLPEGQVGLGRIRVTQQRFEEALPHLQEAARLAPTSEVAHFELHRLYARLGRSKEADEEKAIYDKLHAERLEKMDNVLFRLDRAADAAQGVE